MASLEFFEAKASSARRDGSPAAATRLARSSGISKVTSMKPPYNDARAVINPLLWWPALKSR
jgi:hypothetical protein